VTDDVAAESKFQWMARLGFVVRGFLYIVIALLVIGTGRTEDLTGAMEYLGHGAGRGLLVLMVVGMAGYGLWRMSDAVFGMESGRHHSKAWRRRIAAATSGAIYLFLAYKAVRTMLQGFANAGDAHEHAAAALHLPAGAFLLGCAAELDPRNLRLRHAHHLIGGAVRVMLQRIIDSAHLESGEARHRSGGSPVGRGAQDGAGPRAIGLGLRPAGGAHRHRDRPPGPARGGNVARDARLHGPSFPASCTSVDRAMCGFV